MAKAFDPDFGKDGFARHLFRLRFRSLKITQREFARRFALSYSVVRDAEQGAKPSASLRLIVAAIARDPALMEAAGKSAQDPCTCVDGDRYRCCSDAIATSAR